MEDSLAKATIVESAPGVATFSTSTPLSNHVQMTGSILPDASSFQYVLPRAGMVSLGIYNGDVLIRTLLAGDPQDAGSHTVAWDGLDREGNALPLGQYSWRLLMNDGLKSDFVALIGQTPIQSEKPYERMPGTHQGPSFGFVGSDGSYYQGARNSEGPPCMIGAKTVDGPMKWNRDWQTNGPIDLVELGGSLYLLTWAIKLQQIDPATGKNLGGNNGAEIDLLLPGDTRPDRDFPIASYHVSLGVDGSHLMVAYQARNRIDWIVPTTGSIIRTVSVPSPRYPRAGGPSNSISVLSGEDLVWVASNDAITPIVRELSSPNAMDYNPTTQEFFVAVAGNEQCVVRISAAGSTVQVFGRHGGREYGRYDGRNFKDINYLQCDGAGGFYATETDHVRRVVHINSSGEVVKEWFGGCQFWMVASADPDDLDLVWYNNSYTDITVARMNRAEGTSQVVATYFMPVQGFADGLFPPNSALPEWQFIRKESHSFLIHSCPPAVLRVDEENGVLLPLALLSTKRWGNSSFPNAAINEAMVSAGLTYNDLGSDAYTWHDVSGNGTVTAEGFRFHKSGALVHGTYTSVGIDDDFNLYIGRLSVPNYVYTGTRWINFEFGKSAFLKIPNSGTNIAPIWDWSSQELSAAKMPDDLIGRDASAVIWTPGGVFVALNSGSYHMVEDRHGLIWPDDSYRSTSILCIQPDNSVFSFCKQKSRGVALGAMYRWPGFFPGYTHGCVIASSRNHYGAVAWTYDGLYAGFFLDRHSADLPDWVYTPEGRNSQGILAGDDWNASGTIIDQADGSVLWLPRGTGDCGAFQVTGWDNWCRATGQLNLTRVPTVVQNGDGLVGVYYGNDIFSGTPTATQTDARIWFTQTDNTDGVTEWSTGPCTGITSTQAFSIRWTGHLIAPFSEIFWFRLYNVYEKGAFFSAQWWKIDGGYARLWLNDVLILDLSKGSAQFVRPSDPRSEDELGTFESSPILLSAGERYSLKIKYSYPGAAVASNSSSFTTPEFALAWSSVTKEWSRIPQSFLHTGTVAAKPVVSLDSFIDEGEVIFSVFTPLDYPLTVRYRLVGTDFVAKAGKTVIPAQSTEVRVIVDPGDFVRVTLEPDISYFGDGSAGLVTFNHIVMLDGLVAYYPLDEVNGLVAHDVISNKHAVFNTYMRPPEPVWNPNDGAHNGSLRFSEEGIALEFPFAPITGDFSLAFWFRVDAPRASYPLTRGTLEIWQKDEVLHCLYIGWPVTITSARLDDGVWHQITFTMESATRHIQFYVDGTLAGSQHIGGSFTPRLDPFSVGYTNSFPNPIFIGGWDDVRVYSRALSSAEVVLLATRS